MVAALVPALLGTAPAATPAARGATYDAKRASTWSNGQLAAQLTFSCVDVARWRTARSHAAAGIGGVTLLGTNPSTRLGTQLAKVRAAAPHGVAPFIASDEEGGSVQRLRRVIYRLPSAKTMGTWSDTRIARTAEAYGKRMRTLGVTMNLAPVADLAVRGYTWTTWAARSPAVPAALPRRTPRGCAGCSGPG